MFVEITDDSLGTILEQNEKTIVMYGAGWCGNCRILKPKFKKLSQSNENLQFVYVDAEKNPNSREFTTVKNLPTITGFNRTEVVDQQMGNKIEVIESVLSKL